jgi:hypothetical protein
MSLVMIVIYCLTAAVALFGITFHDELVNDKQRKREIARTFPVNGGKPKLRRHA